MTIAIIVYSTLVAGFLFFLSLRTEVVQETRSQVPTKPVVAPTRAKTGADQSQIGRMN